MHDNSRFSNALGLQLLNATSTKARIGTKRREGIHLISLPREPQDTCTSAVFRVGFDEMMGAHQAAMRNSTTSKQSSTHDNSLSYNKTNRQRRKRTNRRRLSRSRRRRRRRGRHRSSRHVRRPVPQSRCRTRRATANANANANSIRDYSRRPFSSTNVNASSNRSTSACRRRRRDRCRAQDRCRRRRRSRSLRRSREAIWCRIVKSSPSAAGVRGGWSDGQRVTPIHGAFKNFVTQRADFHVLAPTPHLKVTR